MSCSHVEVGGTVSNNKYLEQVHKLYEERKERGSLSKLEGELWGLAIASQYGGTVIGRDGDPYLLRAFLMPRMPNNPEMPCAYLHFFVRGDSDDNPHNHPWHLSNSIILTGGYREFRLNDHGSYDVRCFTPGMQNNIGRETFHYVELLEPDAGCWTLFTASHRHGVSDGHDWGFFDMVTKKVIPWGQYTSTPFSEEIPAAAITKILCDGSTIYRRAQFGGGWFDDNGWKYSMQEVVARHHGWRPWS